MNSWRPFASGLVNHTYEEFRKKYDKLYSANPQQKNSPVKEKFDIKKLFPYKLSDEDMEKRLQNFVNLQHKVEKQRSEIKKRDKSLELKKYVIAKQHKKEITDEKNDKKSKMMRIRSMGVGKSNREKSQEILESADATTFMLTAVDRVNETMNTSRGRFPALTPRSNRNFTFK